jgi:YD repeat-containing protein
MRLDRLTAITGVASSVYDSFFGRSAWPAEDESSSQVQDNVGGMVTRNYDGLNRLVSETTPQGTVSYTYDAAGRRLTMQAASQAQVSYGYDDADHLTGIAQGSTSVAFSYDIAGRRTSAALPGGITATYSWDAASQLTGITYTSGATTLGTLTYGYDLAGRITSRDGTLFQSVLPSAVTSASYDLANRLTSRSTAGVRCHFGTFDGAEVSVSSRSLVRRRSRMSLVPNRPAFSPGKVGAGIPWISNVRLSPNPARTSTIAPTDDVVIIDDIARHPYDVIDSDFRGA